MVNFIEREQAARRLLDEVEAVVSEPRVRSQVPEIVERVDRLRRTGMITVSPTVETNNPPGAVFKILSDRPFRPWLTQNVCLKFYPTYQADAQLGKGTAYFVERSGFAGYRPQPHMIQANMETKETLRFLACAFLHELGHAQAAEDEGRSFKKSTRSIEERLIEEVRIWTTEYKLMVALGGKEFAEAISFAAIDLMDALRRQETVSFEGWGTPLTACVGPPPTEAAMGHRDYSFGIYCQYFMADNYLATAAAERHKFRVQEADYASSYAKEGTLWSEASE